MQEPNRAQGLDRATLRPPDELVQRPGANAWLSSSFGSEVLARTCRSRPFGWKAWRKRRPSRRSGSEVLRKERPCRPCGSRIWSERHLSPGRQPETGFTRTPLRSRPLPPRRSASPHPRQTRGLARHHHPSRARSYTGRARESSLSALSSRCLEPLQHRIPACHDVELGHGNQLVRKQRVVGLCRVRAKPLLEAHVVGKRAFGQ